MNSQEIDAVTDESESWELPRVVLREQKETEIFINGDGDIIIRQPGIMDCDDPMSLLIVRSNLRAFIASLTTLANEDGL